VAGPDILRGNDGPNQLTTFNGNDTVEGRGGNDTLETGNGKDTVHVRDGGPDSVDCGAETDTVTADLPGVDTLLQCEDVTFLTTDTGNPPGGGGATRDKLAPSFVGDARAVPRRFRVDPRGTSETAVQSAAKGTTFRYSLSEAARVVFTIERKRNGRRWGGSAGSPPG
jgi:RTX calcium-binding nonapeptide repeat (4 copies)